MSAVLLRPELAPLLLVVPAAVVGGLLAARARRRALVDLVGPRAAVLADREARGRRALSAALFVLCLLGVVLAALGPAFGAAHERLEERGADVVVALDVSRSMRVRDLAPDRLERARREALALADAARAERLGLVLFAGEAKRVLPPTRDAGAFATLVRAAGPADVPRGGSDLAAALEAAGLALDAAGAEEEVARVVVLLTDGEDLAGRGLEAARRLDASGVVVHAIGFGRETPAPVVGEDGRPVPARRGRVATSALEPARLEAVTGATGGRFLRADRLADPGRRLMTEGVRPLARARPVDGAAAPPDRYRVPLAIALAAGLLALALGRRAAVRAALAGALVLLAGCDATRSGREAFEAGRTEVAHAAFEQALLEAGDDASPALLFDAGVAALAAGDVEAAAAAARRLEAHAEHAGRAAFLRGNVAFARAEAAVAAVPPEGADARAWLPAIRDAEDALAAWQRAVVEGAGADGAARRNVERALLLLERLREERGGREPPPPPPPPEPPPPPPPEPEAPPPPDEAVDVGLREDELPEGRVLEVLRALERQEAEKADVRRAVRREKSAGVERDW